MASLALLSQIPREISDRSRDKRDYSWIQSHVNAKDCIRVRGYVVRFHFPVLHLRREKERVTRREGETLPNSTKLARAKLGTKRRRCNRSWVGRGGIRGKLRVKLSIDSRAGAARSFFFHDTIRGFATAEKIVSGTRGFDYQRYPCTSTRGSSSCTIRVPSRRPGPWESYTFAVTHARTYVPPRIFRRAGTTGTPSGPIRCQDQKRRWENSR